VWPGGIESKTSALVPCLRTLLCQSNHKTQVIWKGRGGLLCYSLTVEDLVLNVISAYVPQIGLDEC
jgi:hypothetical protein